MDQVRTILKVIWEQRFWVLGVLGTIVAVVCWSMATGTLNEEFSKRKSAIDQAFSAVNTIQSEPNHPNEDIIAGDIRQAKQQRDMVRQVWQELYQRQREEVLSWPQALGQDFVKYMDGKEFLDNISLQMRERYLNYIENRFDALLEIVQAKKIVDRRSARSAGRGREGGEGFDLDGGGFNRRGAASEDSDDDDYLVQWTDQGMLAQKLSFPTTPSSEQVWVTQEDLWVYETLLNVIADTNKARKATRPDNTAVRVIEQLDVGAAAGVVAGGSVYIPQAMAEGAGGGRGGEEFGGYGEFDEGSYGRGGYGEAGFGGEMMGGRDEGFFEGRGRGGMDEGISPLANRYLDSEGKPDPNTSGSFGTAEYRQLPIRMNLTMDQRWLPRLLIECANAPLPVEVNQVRVNPNQAGAVLGSRSGGGMRSRTMQTLTPDPNLAEVEIRGVVYIYKKPDPQQLTVPGDEQNDNSLADNN